MASPLDSIKNLPTWAKVTVAVGSAGVIYFAYRQHKNSAANAAPAASATGIDPVTGLPYSQDNQVDPATGMTYLQEAQEYGSVSAAESGYATGGYSGAYGYGGIPYSYTPGTQTGTGYATNAQWAQAVEAGLSDIGYSQIDVAAALGRYLGKLSLTSAQAQLIYAALAEYGDPPSGSYQVILAPNHTPNPNPNPKTFPPLTQVEVPDVIGVDLVTAQKDIGYAGLKSTASGPHTTVKGEVREVTSQSPKAGSKVDKGTSVHLTYKIANPPKKK